MSMDSWLDGRDVVMATPLLRTLLTSCEIGNRKSVLDVVFRDDLVPAADDRGPSDMPPSATPASTSSMLSQTRPSLKIRKKRLGFGGASSDQLAPGPIFPRVIQLSRLYRSPRTWIVAYDPV